ncbi:hypothetical protein [Taibaiella koreensis]|uniref:hypothetical protein n=1 Tax=Taibaiella koreensis TaxID=1268548 RepID=UPI000E5A024B|nr:hypothetical protein [Taibaiella koreensis]
MKYCTFSFSVHYNNRKVKSGVAPYRGENLEAENLREFVQEYFSGAPESYNQIEVKVEKEFEGEEQWIKGVIDLDTFRYLQKVNGYAGELLQKYFDR